MAALDFPASPTVGQIYTANGKSWQWDGTSWNSYNQITSLTGVTLSNCTINGTTSLGGNIVASGAYSISAVATSSINNFSIGASTPSTGNFTTLGATGNVTLGDAAGDTLTINAGTTTFVQGTANGVLYLNGSKVATSGSALTYSGGILSNTTSVGAISAVFTDATYSTLKISHADTSGDITFLNGANAPYCSFGASVKLYTGVTQTATITSKGLLVGYTSDSSLSSTGNAIFSGNVGISTNSPVRKLHVGSVSEGNGVAVTGTAPNISISNADTNPNANSITTVFALATSAGNYGLNSGEAAWLGVGNSRGNFIINPNYSGTGTKDVIIQPTSGNLGLGVTPSAWTANAVFENVGGSIWSNATSVNYYIQNAYFGSGSVWRYRTTNPAAMYHQYLGQHIWSNAPSGTAGNAISFTQAMTLDASGNLIVGDTSAVAGERLYVKATASTGFAFRFYNTQATAGSTYGQYILYTASSPNGASNQFLRCDDSTTTRAEIRSNGGLANFSANNVNLSDERVKTAITPAPSWLAKINAIEVVNFKYKDQTHEDPNLGVIAQQVLSVAPELVDEDGFGETPEDGVPLMAIYETDLKYAMLKAIQELASEIEQLKSKLN